MKRVFIYPGEIYVAQEHTQFSTILGSCVSVILFEKTSLLCGMNHYLLPYPIGNNTEKGRFGSLSIPQMIQQLLDLGAEHSRLNAKIFGGGAVVSQLIQGQKVGEMNVECALHFLKEARIPIVAQDVLGTKSRKLTVDSLSHSVKVIS